MDLPVVLIVAFLVSTAEQTGAARVCTGHHSLRAINLHVMFQLVSGQLVITTQSACHVDLRAVLAVMRLQGLVRDSGFAVLALLQATGAILRVLLQLSPRHQLTAARITARHGFALALIFKVRAEGIQGPSPRALVAILGTAFLSTASTARSRPACVRRSVLLVSVLLLCVAGAVRAVKHELAHGIFQGLGPSWLSTRNIAFTHGTGGARAQMQQQAILAKGC